MDPIPSRLAYALPYELLAAFEEYRAMFPSLFPFSHIDTHGVLPLSFQDACAYPRDLLAKYQTRYR